MSGDDAEGQRVEAAVGQHTRRRRFEEADKAISIVLSDPQVQQAGAQVEAAETLLGMALCARLKPFQDRYEKAVRGGDTDVLSRICPGKHGRWGRICVLDAGHEIALEEPHWGHNAEGRPIAWVGSAPDHW